MIIFKPINVLINDLNDSVPMILDSSSLLSWKRCWGVITALTDNWIYTLGRENAPARQQKQDHIPQHAAVCVSAGMCVGETVQKTKQEQREKKERDCRKRVTLSKATPSPPGLFFRYICPFLTKAALCGAAAVIVALGRRSDVCSTLSFLRLALKFGREHQNSVLDKCSLCFSEL